MKHTNTPPAVLTEICTGCGLCVELCPGFVLEMAEKKAWVARGDWCIGCGHCGAVCPVGAIRQGTFAAKPYQQRGRGTPLKPERLLPLLRERRSVRIYRDKPIPKKMLEQILDAGRYAPTGRNSQNVRYILMQSPDEIARLREMTMGFYAKVFARTKGAIGALLLRLVAGRRMAEYLRESMPKIEHAKKLIDQGKDCLFYGAPAVMVVHAESWDTCSAFNCAVALYNCSLMAHTLGVGCCFNGYLQSAINNDRRIKRWLSIPQDHQCFGAMTLGYQKVTFARLVERDPAKVTWQ